VSGWIDVAPVDLFPPGTQREVDADGTSIVVFALEDGYFALENTCSHDGGTLTGGCVQGERVICPRHGAQFSIRTGEALSAPAFEPATVFPVEVQAGMVRVRDDRWD
jgi:3-phenylpropionate/trans-cinnamate dioxygenase ferredoxin subunit